jgi:hypothetical protein
LDFGNKGTARPSGRSGNGRGNCRSAVQQNPKIIRKATTCTRVKPVYFIFLSEALLPSDEIVDQ